MQFNVPNTSFGSGGFATIAAAGVPVTFSRVSRQIQFALKFFW